MNFDINNLWTDTITVVNKLPARFASNKQTDLYFKHVINNCNWHIVRQSKTNDATLLKTARVIIQIPKQDNYVPYASWIYLPVGLTFCVDDYIFLGQIKESIDCSNINNIFLQYRQNAIKIKAFQDATLSGQTLPKIKNISIAHYYIEGS